MVFNIGDRVTVSKNIGDVIFAGETGTIVCKFSGPLDYGVCWDKYHPQMHSLDGKCEDGHGWWTNGHYLFSAPDEPFSAASDEDFSRLLDSPGER